MKYKFNIIQKQWRASLTTQTVKDLPAMQETWVWSLGWEDPLQKGMATHSNILDWRIPWIEEPGRLQSMGLQRVGHHRMWPQGASKGASEKSGYCGFGRGLSGLHCFWCNGRGPHLEWSQEPQGSSPFRTPIAGSLQSWDRRVRPRLEWRNGTLLASRVVHGMTGLLSSL